MDYEDYCFNLVWNYILTIVPYLNSSITLSSGYNLEGIEEILKDTEYFSIMGSLT